MSDKYNVRKLPTLCPFHIPISHRRFQNRAAAVYDMSIDCHDIETICHIHRLSEAIIIQDWKGNFDYLNTKLNLHSRKDIEKRFLTIMKEIQDDNIQPTLASVTHHIPYIYIEQAITDQDITTALNRFLDDFNPKKFIKNESKKENVIQERLNNGQPILTAFEKHLLLQHLIDVMSTKKFRKLNDIEKCLLQYIQLIVNVNYSSLKNISYLNKKWLKTFLIWASPHMKSVDISWLNVNKL